MHSIRRRLLLVLSIGFAAVIAVTMLYLETIIREHETEEFDAALLAEIRGLRSLISVEDGVVEFEYAPEHMPHFERTDRPDYFQIWLDDGTVLPEGRSGSLKGGEALPRFDSLSPEAVFRDAPLPDGRSGRAVQIAFAPGPDRADQAAEEPAVASSSVGRAFVLMVARGRERLDRLLASMRLAIFGAGGIAMLLAAVFVWRALAFGFRPIRAIAVQVEDLHAENLGARLAAPEAPSELAPIVHQLNALLARLEASFDRERRFAGHVAHELRTPIAELRSLAEVGGKWPEDLASTRRFFADVHGIAGRMEHVVVDLLLLARCHAGVERVERGAVPLKEAVLSCLSQLGTRDRVEVDMPEGLVADSDPGKLSLVLTNLLDNAVSHALPEGPVRCVAEARGAWYRVDIVNPALPLTEADLANLAEPFWRKDGARSEGHSGLGLSLVTALSGLLGLEVGFSQEGGFFRAHLRGRLWNPGGPKPSQRFVREPELEPEYKEKP